MKQEVGFSPESLEAIRGVLGLQQRGTPRGKILRVKFDGKLPGPPSSGESTSLRFPKPEADAGTDPPSGLERGDP